MNIDLLAFPGHKGLYGPQGTGGLYISPKLHLDPLLHGGTGSQSELIEQPQVRPEKYESGTLNTPGIAGLNAGVEFVLQKGIDQIYAHEQELTQYALEKLRELKGIRIYGPDEGEDRGPLISLNIEGVDGQEAAHILDQHYGIAVRAGMHCTPLGHQSMGTEQTGAIRISFGFFNQKEEIDQLLRALEEIRVGLLAN